MINKLVISTVNHDKMIRFYSALLKLDFRDTPIGDLKLSTAVHNGFTLLLCPAAISGVTTETNNIQPTFVLTDVEGARARALASGGSPISEEPTAGDDTLTWDIRDPDGNSVELFCTTGN